MIFKQETIQSWFSGVESSINNEVIQPFQNAEQVIWKYNQAIQHNSLTQQGWERLLAQSDDSLKAYLTSIKGTTATMTGYNVSLQGNITGFKKVSSAITQYNSLSASGTKEQNMFANAVSVTNGKLGTYLTGLNGAKASLSGYVISLVGATVKTVALKIATIALNSAITMGASLIISGVVSAISEWIHKTENMISASEDAIEKIKSINDELKNNQKTISDTAKRYAELAQGVDQLTGKNISLSNEDYEEFLTLSNQLAEMFPTLTRNYNDNGDAIVQLSGDVDTIVGSLQNLIEAQRDLANRQIVDELPTVFDGVAAKSDKYEQQLSDLESRRDTLVKSLGDVQSEEFSSNFMDGFSNKWIEISGNNLEVISQMRDDYMKILEEANIDFEELTPTYEMKDGIEVPVGFTIKINSSDEDVEKAKNTIDGKIQELASQYETDINKLNEEINTTNEKNKANWTSLSSSIFAWLSTDDSFKVMDDTMQATVQNIVNSLDWGKLNFSSWEEAKQYIQDNILSLFNTPEGKETLADIEVMFGIQTQFNNGDINVEQYQQKLQEFLNSIENLPPETKKSILLLFGIQTNDDGTTTSDVDTMVENVKKKLKGTEFDDKVGELSLGDLKIAADLEVGDDTIQSWDDLIERIEKVKIEAFKSGISFNIEDFSNSISEITSAYSTLSSAIEEYNANGAYSLETMTKLLSLKPEYLALLVDENGKLALNEQGLRSIIQAQLEQAQAEIYATGIAKLKALSDEEAGNVSETAASKMSDSSSDIDIQTQAYKENTEAALLNIAAKAKENGANQTDVDSIVEETEAQVKAIQDAVKGLSFDVGGVTGGFKSAAKSSIDTWKEAFQAEYNLLKHNLEMEYITEEQYYNSLNALNQKYFAGKSEYLDEYRQYEEEVYKGLKNIYKDYVDSYLSYMEQSLESSRIDYKTYSRDVAKFLKDMYEQGKIAAKDYYDYTKEMLEVQKDAMDGVISAVVNRLDKEINSYEDQIDEVEKRYQTEIDYLDTVIEYYEDQKKALQDTNDELDRQKALEEALYNLKRAQNQRTKALYTADKGKIYTTDTSAIRDAEEEVRQSKLDIEIAKLDEAIEKLEQQQDALQDAMDREKEQLQTVIDRLEDYKDQWNSVSDEYENAQNEMYANGILGLEWQKEVLNGNQDILNTFRNNYISIQQSIADAAWASANSQIAALNAVKAAEATKEQTSGGSSASVGNSNNTVTDITPTTTTKKISSTKTNTVYGGKGGNIKTMQRYGTGTDDAEPGVHKVAENGAEIIRDNYGNAYVAEGEQLHYFEGGETVIKASESAKILANMDNLIPLQDYADSLSGLNLRPIDYGSMVMSNMKLPDFSKFAVNRGESTTISIGDIHLHEVQNVPDFAKALQKHLPNISVQYNGKH